MIAWDGGGPIPAWNNPLNWVGDVLPGATDDAVIGAAFAGVNITSSANVTVNSVTNAGSLTLTGGTFTIAAASQVSKTLALHGGTLAGTGNLAVNGTLNWDSTPTGLAGNITGTGTLTIVPGAAMNILGTGGRSIQSRTLDNQGTVNWSGTGNINVGNASLIQNRAGAVFNITNAGFMGNGGGAPSTFTNDGTLIKQTGSSSTSPNMAFNNSGVVEVQSGTFTLLGTGTSTGTWSVAAGATLNPTGTHTFTTASSISGLGTFLAAPSGTLAVNGSYTVNSTTINTASGTLSFSGAIPVSIDTLTFTSGTLAGSNDVTITRKLDYTGGTMTMTGTGNTIIAPGAVVTHAGGGQAIFNGRDLDNYGAFNWTGTGSVGVGGSAVLTNKSGAEWNITNTGSFNPVSAGPVTFVNEGTFTKTGGTSSLSVGVNLVNRGILDVQGGTLNIPNSLVIDGNGIITGLPGAVVAVGGHVDGNTVNADQFAPSGTVNLNGPGTAASPRFLEVMSSDLGAVNDGYIDNFAYDRLSLSPNGFTGTNYVRLVDSRDNAAGAGAEAVYVDTLIVPLNTTLDLNGFKVYPRNAQIAGTVIGGTITVLNDGGPLQLNAPTVGSISAVGQTDTWTFFGRAGQRVTLRVETGASGTPVPVNPPLNFAELSIIDPNSVVLATNSNSTSGASVNLLNVPLAEDGVYQVRVKAPAAQPGSTGNYIVVVWDATIQETFLNVNQTTTDTLDTIYQVDKWNFAANAGEQIQFDFINQSNGHIRFDLTGPGGPIFTNLAADSSLLTLTSSGEYTLSAYMVSGYGGSAGYSFRMVHTPLTVLTSGVPYNGTLVASGQSHLFRLNVADPTPLQILFDDANNADRVEIYVKQGSAPTRADIQFSSADLASANQRVGVPMAAPGDWYILLYAPQVPSPSSNYTLVAEESSVRLQSTTPDHHAVDQDMVLTLTGVGFSGGTTVKLVSGATEYAADTVQFDTPTQVTATFNANTVPAGTYDIVAEDDGDVSTLPNAFEAISTGQANLVANLVLPSALGYHMNGTIYIEVANTGDAVMPAPLFVLRASQNGVENAIMTLDSNLVASGAWWTSGNPDGFFNTIQVMGSGATPGVIQPGESFRVPVYWVGWYPGFSTGSGSTFDFTLETLDATNTTPIDWVAMEPTLQPPGIGGEAWDAIYANLQANVGSTWGDYVTMLSDNARYLGQLGLTVRDAADLWGFEIQQAIGIGQAGALAAASDSGYPAPGMSLGFGRVFSGSLTGRFETGPFGRGWFSTWQTTLAVDAAGTVIIEGPGGSQRRFQPDSRNPSGYFPGLGDEGKLTPLGGGVFELTELDGTRTRFRADGLLDFIEDTNSNRITAGYASGQLTSLTHSSGKALTIAYNGAGLIDIVTDPDGRVTTYTYDAANEHLLEVTHFDGTITRYTYAADHALLSIEYADGTHDYFGYDAQGHLIRTEGDNGEGRIDYTFDVGKVTATDLLGASSEAFFDHRGLKGKAVDPLGRTSFLTFDADYNLTQTTDPFGQNAFFSYDTRGNLTRSIDSLGQITNFTYGGLNRLTSFTDPKGQTTRYNYDVRGNLFSIYYPNNTSEGFRYDPLGNMTESINRRGHAIDYQYDTDGRLLQKAFADGTTSDFAYDPRGNLLSVTNPEGVTSMTYEPLTDRLTRVTYPAGKFLDFFYDAAGRRIRSEDQDGFSIKYFYDTQGRLEFLRDGSDALVVEYQYDVAGRLTGKLNGNGTSTSYQYDPAGQLLSLINYAPGGAIENSRFDYTYDTLGRRITMQTLDGDWAYEYDAIGQLTHAVFTSTGALPNQDLLYVYDAAGNRTQTIINGVTTTYTSNNLNQYTQIGSTTYQYDADGNILSSTTGGVTTYYTFDDQNHLVAVNGPAGSFSYDYDGLGNRIGSTANGIATQYVIDPAGLGNVVGEYTGAGAMIAKYTHGLGLVSRTDAGGSAFYDFDGIGSTAGISNAAGNYANKYHYLPFGETTATMLPTLPNPFTFVGAAGVMQDPSGLSYMRARYYTPGTGQFTSNDPIGLSGGDTNIRRYVGNNPAGSIDPQGLRDFSQLPKANQYNEQTNRYFAMTDDEVYAVAGEEYGAFDRLHYDTAAYHAQANHFGKGTPILDQFGAFGAVLLTNLGGLLTEIHQLANELGYLSVDNYELDEVLRMSGFHYQDLLSNFWGSLAGVGWSADLFPDPPPGTPIANSQSKSAAAQDPNEKVGPTGFGTPRFVTGDGLLAYRVDFENESTATAPAQRVVVTDQLDTDLDWDTFEFADFGFGDFFIAVPEGRRYFQTVVQMTYNSQTFDVEVELSFDPTTGLVRTVFQSIDPNTKLPTDVLTGMLPPEDGTGRGKGFFSYLVRAKPGLPTGTEIRNIALIKFDTNEIIATNQIDPHDASQGIDPEKEALNTIDSGAPTSAIDPLPPIIGTTSFTVSWTGSDDAGGSGIATFDIFVSDNGGAFTLLLDDTTLTSTTFTGVFGRTYSFQSLATDNLGHVELSPAAPQTTTLVSPDSAPPTITQVNSTTSNGSYAAGASINVTVNFSEPVTLAGGNLTVNLDTGGSITIAPFSNATSASGTYIVAAGENSADLNSNSPLVLDAGATLRDAAGNDATLTIPAGQSLADVKSIVIDTATPAITGVSSTLADGSYTVGQVIPITITFDEVVNVSGTPQLTLETGATDAVVNYSSGSGTDTLTFGYTVAVGQTSADLDYISSGALTLNGGTIQDPAGNSATPTLAAPGTAGSLGANKNIVIDTLAPTATITDDQGGGTIVAGTPVIYTMQFDEVVAGVEQGDFSNAGTAPGTFSGFTMVDADTYNVTFTPSGPGTLQLRINNQGAVIEDPAGNDLATPVTDDTTLSAAPTSREFDFQPSAASPLQAGAIAVLPSTGYTAALGYGWTKTPWRTTDAGPLPSLAGNPLAFQLRDYMSDFGGLSSAGIFRVDFLTTDPVQITAFLGDASGALDGIEVAFSTNGTTYTPFTPGGGLAIPASKFTSVTSPAVIPGLVGGTRSVWIRIQDLAGSTSNWSASGLAVRAVGSVGVLNVTPSEGSVPADGTTVDTYTVTGAAPGAVLNISASLGTILTDARTELLGNQVIADGTGMGTFQVRRPFVNGNSTITVSDFTGAATRTITQTYDLVTTRKFDMNASTPSLPDASWLDVRTSSLYSAAAGYGWTTAPTAADLGTYPAGSTAAQQALYRDYHSGTSTNTFKVYVGAFCTVNVKIYRYTPSLNTTGMTVSLEGGAFQPVSGNSTTFVATTGADGILDITFKAAMFANWATNGIEIS